MSDKFNIASHPPPEEKWYELEVGSPAHDVATFLHDQRLHGKEIDINALDEQSRAAIGLSDPVIIKNRQGQRSSATPEIYTSPLPTVNQGFFMMCYVGEDQKTFVPDGGKELTGGRLQNLKWYTMNSATPLVDSIQKAVPSTNQGGANSPIDGGPATI